MNKQKRIRLIKSLARILLAVGVVIVGLWIYVAQPTWKSNSPSAVQVNQDRLRQHVIALSEEFHPRDYGHVENLDRAANYIAEHFTEAGGEVQFQEYSVAGENYRNVQCMFGEGKGNRLIIGAHYDSFDVTPGADDNASGVAGLLELAYLFGTAELDREIELVAYTLEEPPFFATSDMGSHVHAQSVATNSTDIHGVIVLEMIGCFSDKWGSQGHPLLLLKLVYPNRGNFITVVGNMGQRAFTKQVKVTMKGTTDLPVYSLNAPRRVPGVDFSDHRSYWPHDIQSVMITDTSFYRNKAYHATNDTVDHLDFDRMADVVIGVYEVARSK